MQTFKGVVIGGEDDGQLTSCSRDYYTHLSRDGKTYVKYWFNRKMGVWTTCQNPEVNDLKQVLSVNYELLRGRDIGKLQEFIEARLVLLVHAHSEKGEATNWTAFARQHNVKRSEVNRIRRKLGV